MCVLGLALTQVRMLHEHASGKATRDFQKNKPQLLATLADMPVKYGLVP